MTIYYPDISSYNTGVGLNGAPAVCIKVTEGTSYVNPDYSAALGRAHSAGAYPFAYHFLRQGNAAAQASWAHQHAGSTPLMLDFEPTGNSHPQVGDATAFIDEYRKLGGIIHLNYFPHWYWQQIGSPSLQPFVSRNLFLVSSAYTAYTDEPRGVGWLPYGGQHPSIWQYTSSQPFNGQNLDFNAYRGSLDQLKAMVGAGDHPPAGPPPPRPARLPRSPTHPPTTWASRLPTRTATPASSAAATTSTCIPGNIRWPTGVGASPKMAAMAGSPTRYAGHSKPRRD
jgi:glycosyl hydrolase family 25